VSSPCFFATASSKHRRCYRQRNPHRIDKTVALYRRELTKYFPSAQPNFVSLEGFVDALVLLEGLKHAGRELTREGLIRGIEAIHDLDVGLGPQLKLDYSGKDHKGFDQVLPSVIRGGRAVPFTDWSTITPK
jgi:branched-chain amino acid transport system substrate-binding protein